ncbi:MAG: hypothetical protein AAGE80_19050 [Pseudomonadota bacterium]
MSDQTTQPEAVSDEDLDAAQDAGKTVARKLQVDGIVGLNTKGGERLDPKGGAKGVLSSLNAG